jgi:hypothetical protein
MSSVCQHGDVAATVAATVRADVTPRAGRDADAVNDGYASQPGSS